MFVALEDWHDDMADVLEMSLFAEASSHVQLVTLVADVCWADISCLRPSDRGGPVAWMFQWRLDCMCRPVQSVVS